MQLLKINYKGEYYTNRKIDFMSDLFNVPMIIVDSVPAIINNFCKTTILEDKVKLSLGNIVFSVDKEDNAVFEEQYIKEICFDKLSLKAKGEKIEISDFAFADLNFYNNFSLFLEEIIFLNDNISNHLKSRPKYLKLKADNSTTFLTTMKNFYNILIFNFSEYEKIITSDSCSLLEANLKFSDFSIEEAAKLSQAMGLPKFALNTIKELDLEECLNEVRILSKKIDGNSLKIIFDFIDKMSIIFKRKVTIKQRTTVMKKFLLDLGYILDNGYKITDLLNYLLRQNLYYTLYLPFGFPFEEATYLADYIKMAKKFNIKTDKYPSQLKRQHDLMSKNLVTLEQSSEELEAEFMRSVSNYKSVQKEIKVNYKDNTEKDIIKEYVFLVPTCIHDIIEEGVNLHHCVSSYSDRIINQTSRIVFMREKNNSKQSFITIDIDKDYNLVEAKKAFNEEVDPDNQKAIDKWLKEIKK